MVEDPMSVHTSLITFLICWIDRMHDCHASKQDVQDPPAEI